MSNLPAAPSLKVTPTLCDFFDLSENMYMCDLVRVYIYVQYFLIYMYTREIKVTGWSEITNDNFHYVAGSISGRFGYFGR